MYFIFSCVPIIDNILPFIPPVRTARTPDKVLFQSIDYTHIKILGRNALGIYDVVEYQKNELDKKNSLCTEGDG